MNRKSVLSCRCVAIPLFVSLLLSGADLAAQTQDPGAAAGVYLEQLWRSSGAPAVSAAVACQGKLVFSGGMGFSDLDNLVPATGSTVYNIGSVSKTLAAVALMQLVEQGKVSPSDPIRKYLPEFPTQKQPITILHILTHTSGIRHYRDSDFIDGLSGENVTPFTSFGDAIGLFKDDSLLFVPGEYYLYSSFAVNLLQGVIERASGMAFEEYMIQHIWRPVGMLRTSFDIPHRIVPGRAKSYDIVKGQATNHPYGDLTYKFAGGGMLSSVEDLIRFGIALNHGGLLKPETVALMFKPQLETVLRFQGEGKTRRENFQQALIWRVRKDDSGRSFIYHCGTVKGFNACLVDYVEEDIVVAIADNAEAIGFRPALILADFFRSAASGD